MKENRNKFRSNEDHKVIQLMLLHVNDPFHVASQQRILNWFRSEDS